MESVNRDFNGLVALRSGRAHRHRRRPHQRIPEGPLRGRCSCSIAGATVALWVDCGGLGRPDEASAGTKRTHSSVSRVSTQLACPLGSRGVRLA